MIGGTNTNIEQIFNLDDRLLCVLFNGTDPGEKQEINLERL